MAAKHKAGEMDGFDIVRAVQHARTQQGSAPPPPRKPPPAPSGKPPDAPDEGLPRSVRIGKTAVPTKYEYTCYQCGYAFTVAGKVQTLYCAKCRTILNQSSYTIDKRHDVSIVTAGTVTITSTGIWAGNSLTAREVVLEGQHEQGHICASNRLIVGPGCLPRMADIEAPDLVVRPETSLFLDAPASFRNVELAGEMTGELEVRDLVTIRAGAHFKGKLTARRLILEEGGGLTADVIVGPEAFPPETHVPPQKESPRRSPS